MGALAEAKPSLWRARFSRADTRSRVPSQALGPIQYVDRRSLESFLGRGLSLAEIGRRVGLHDATLGYRVKKHGLQAVNREKHAARGGMAREELKTLVEAGMSISQIGEKTGRSSATVRHWLLEYGLKTRRAESAAHGWRTSSSASARSMA